MLRWLAALLRERDRFRVPAHVKLPPCRVRALRKEDVPACQALYRLNEPNRFPAGYFDHFSGWLTERDGLILVVEAYERIAAVGGIFTYDRPALGRRAVAVLAYGMVHPDHHRQGLGTVLL